MKKSLMILGVLSLGLAQAQQQVNDPYEGKVGINTKQPSATLNVKSIVSDGKNLELENSTGTKLVTVLDDGKVGIGTGTPTSSLEIFSRPTVTDFDRERGKKDMILIKNVNNAPSLNKESKASISGSMTLRPNYRGHSIDFGLIDLHTATRPFISFSVAPFEGYPSDQDMTVEHMRIMHTGNIGMGTTKPTHKLHIKADTNNDPLKLEGLREATSTGNKPLVVDANGVVKVGEAISSTNTGSVKIGAGANAQCTDNTIGTINFGEVTTSEGTAYAFGFCTKDANNKPMWTYMISGNNPFSSTNPTFGSGL